jgi:uncharacterized membrane protein YjgN (DUF898 family)
MAELNTKRPLSFHGEGSKLFGITIINAILTILTLGFYYPWAKVAKLHYMYHETEFEGSRFEFHGTGKEVFRGFIKAILIIAILYGAVWLAQMTFSMMIIFITMLCVYAATAFLIPLAIHGSVRYRLSRTSWRGIHFGYRGDRKELTKLFLKNVFLTIITLGIYTSWLTINLRKYVIGHIRFGNIEFSYKGDGAEYFGINFKDYLLTILTLGIYLPWYMKDLTNYYIDNIRLQQGDKTVKLKSHITGGGYFKLFIVNALIVIFTLGFAMPWAVVRTMKFVSSHIEFIGELDIENIQQTEEDYKNATGDDLADMLDLDLI